MEFDTKNSTIANPDGLSGHHNGRHDMANLSLAGADSDTDVESDIIELKGKSLSCPAVMVPNRGYGSNIPIQHNVDYRRDDDYSQQQEYDEFYIDNDDVIELKGKSLSSPAFIGHKDSEYGGNLDVTALTASHREAQKLTHSSYYPRGVYSHQKDSSDDQFFMGNSGSFEQAHSFGQDLYDSDTYRAQQRPITLDRKAQLAGRWLQPQGGGDVPLQQQFSRRVHALMGHATEVGVSPISRTLGSGGLSSNYLYTVRFKNTTDTFSLAPCCRSNITVGDYVLVEADRGLDVGRVTELYSEVMDISFVKKILSRASPEEVQHSVLKEKDEKMATEICRTLVARRGLRIAIADAEYQFDRKKLTFFFISERHTDFRELVRDLFATFKTRIWMQKIKSHEVSVLRPYQLPEHSRSSQQSSGGYLPAGRYGGGGGSSHYESDATGGGGRSVYRPGDTTRDGVGGTFVYQQQVAGDHNSYQFGGSLPPSPTYREAGAPFFGGSYSQQRPPVSVSRGNRLQQDPMNPRIYLEDGALHGLTSDPAGYPPPSRGVYDAVEAPRSSSDSRLVTWAQQQRSDGMGGRLLPDGAESESDTHLSGAGQSADVTAIASELSTLSVAAKPFVYQGGLSHYSR